MTGTPSVDHTCPLPASGVEGGCLRVSPAGMDAGGTRHGGRLGARSEHQPTRPDTALSVGLEKSAALTQTQKHHTLAVPWRGERPAAPGHSPVARLDLARLSAGRIVEICLDGRLCAAEPTSDLRDRQPLLVAVVAGELRRAAAFAHTVEHKTPKSAGCAGQPARAQTRWSVGEDFSSRCRCGQVSSELATACWGPSSCRGRTVNARRCFRTNCGTASGAVIQPSAATATDASDLLDPGRWHQLTAIACLITRAA